MNAKCYTHWHPRSMRALVVGWFSYENSDATAGDLLAKDVVCEWLSAAGLPFDVALASAFPGGIEVERVSPADYPLVVFVCGPFMRNHWEAAFLGKFADCCVVGVNVSLPIPIEQWQPFDSLFERDSNQLRRADVTFVSRVVRAPVIGVCLVEPYAEADVPKANRAVGELLSAREVARVPIDTRLDVNATGLRTTAEVESLLAHMDAVVTTRLHGMVLSLKHGVPALVIDPEPGGGRISRQANAIGWPAIFAVGELEADRLDDALDYCLSASAQVQARDCATRAARDVRRLRERFIAEIRATLASPTKRQERRAFREGLFSIPPTHNMKDAR